MSTSVAIESARCLVHHTGSSRSCTRRRDRDILQSNNTSLAKKLTCPFCTDVTVVDDDKDPVIGDYEVFITDSDVQRYLFQYPDRSKAQPYHEANHQQPTELRIKPKNGLVEVDIPINTAANYNVKKGVQFGEALRKSRITKAGGSHGLAGGFNSGPAGRARYEDEDEDKIDLGAVRHYDGHMDIDDDDERKKGVELARHTLGGRIVAPSDHDPVYMLGAFRGSKSFLSRQPNSHPSPTPHIIQHINRRTPPLPPHLPSPTPTPTPPHRRQQRTQQARLLLPLKTRHQHHDHRHRAQTARNPSRRYESQIRRRGRSERWPKRLSSVCYAGGEVGGV